MTEKQAGLSAMGMAYMRAYHATHESPLIFDDFLASGLFTPEDLAQTDQTWAGLLQYVEPELAATNPDPATALGWVVQSQGAITLGRSRYTEDSLQDALGRGVRQYVLLGAGFDTFAYRRPDLVDRLHIFEVDHPATQAIKRERIARQGWDDPANLHYIPLDFTHESLSDALVNAGFDPRQLSFFSWLGVSYYLTHAVVVDTLRSIVSIAALGSTVVFDYMDTDAFIPEKTARRVQLMQFMAVQLGEPMKTGFDPAALAADLDRLGLRLDENLDPAATEARYFRGRADRYHAIEHIHFARAVVA
ncbi:MAG TPA: SAM-dependent methyltransferase [Aggregatilinea sp.]|uniref:class I SAM-dependent methyltransferase n=1 Tax=Aggregatilinea sp. TaxID=2806333 RepID=UPI002C83BD29|nr:SAM-dependent methyltransferase [Aggregatilinea sp.]HML22242.1 SAM-dependent methyltransferase [Aggregatilinea sp.]